MAKLIPVSRSAFSDKRWRRHRDYLHAAQAQTAPVVFSELSKLVLHYPFGFAKNNVGTFSPLCLLGLEANQNLFVGPQGQWIGDYIPACFRSYPFNVANTEDGQQLLCFDQDSGLLSSGPEDEIFFTDDGESAEAVQSILNFLNQLDASKKATSAMCAALAQLNLLKPWPITLPSSQGEKTIKGLYCIDEAALNDLDSNGLHQLHQARALGLAYFQLLSMQHLTSLGQRYQTHLQQLAAAQTPVANEELPTIKDYGDISFDELL